MYFNLLRVTSKSIPLLKPEEMDKLYAQLNQKIAYSHL